MTGTVTTSMVCSFKQQAMTGTFDFTNSTGHVFKFALVKVSPTGSYDKTTTNYTGLTGNSDEVSGTGYSAGGFAWTAAQNTSPATDTSSTNNIAYASWSTNPSFTSATFTTIAGIIYDSTASTKAVSVHDFGGTQTVSAGTITFVLPSANSSNAILRFV